MSCNNSSSAVKQQLESVAGVSHVNVNISEGSVTIYFVETSTELEAIQQLASDFGYLGLSQLIPHHQFDHKLSTNQPNISANTSENFTFTKNNLATKTEDFKLTDITQQITELLKRLFSSLDSSINLRLWNGETLQLGNSNHDLAHNNFTLVCRSSNAIKAMVLGRDPLRFAEAYFRNDIDIEGDFFAALKLKDHLHSIRMNMLDKVGSMFSAFRLPFLPELNHAQNTTANFSNIDANNDRNLHANHVKMHSKTENQQASAFHHDISNDFYTLWLGESMIYSCAYFEHADDTLAQAQEAKLDHICNKLQLKPGERLLDIGCGWGALVMHAARYYGVTAHGITLSERQFAFAKQRIFDAGLQDKVTILLRDYRDLAGECIYDKISSIGMFEHIGLKNLPVYFSTVNRLLKPTGIFLSHGITHFNEGWNKTLSTEFINRYVFPDGQLDTISNIQKHMETAKFEIADVEALRRHYALTLRHWVTNLEARHEEALQYVDEATYRIWRLYMAACALEFESGEIGVYQVLATKISNGASVIPLTRQYMYPPEANAADVMADQSALIDYVMHTPESVKA